MPRSACRCAQEIRKLQKDLGITTVYVTHDQEEALTLSDRIAVIQPGQACSQVGPPKALYERPENRFVADFIGINNMVEASVQAISTEASGGCRSKRPSANSSRDDSTSACGPATGASSASGPRTRTSKARPTGIATREGRITFAAYLGNTLRYDVEVGARRDLQGRYPRPVAPRAAGRPDRASSGQLPGRAARSPSGGHEAASRTHPARSGFVLIWAFLILFVFFPLTRIFYDAFTNEAGEFTIANFTEFFTDKFYLRSLWKSLLLGLCRGLHHIGDRHGGGRPARALRVSVPQHVLLLTMLPMILPPLVGVLGFVFILGRAGTVNILLDGVVRPAAPDQLHVRRCTACCWWRRCTCFPMMTLSASWTRSPRSIPRWKRRRKAWARRAGAGSATSRCR